MKFVFAPDSFKGTLSSKEIIHILERKAKEIFPEVDTIGIPIADGGEGTIEAVHTVVGGELKTVQVKNPLGEKVAAQYLILEKKKALIEMAKASGITLIPYQDGNAMLTTSYGTGELIKDALEQGIRDFTIAIGGSATNDGGIGMLAALGYRFYDKEENLLEPIGANLEKIAKIDDQACHPAIKESTFVVMCDVENPLLGPEGATFVFGPQKGVTKEYLIPLESGMKNYAECIKKQYGYDVADEKGAGAAGGMGAALLVFCNAKLQSGIQTIFQLIAFEKRIEDADLIITGEGRVDGQSVHGKVLDGIGKVAQAKHIPVIAIAGGMGDGAEQIYKAGIDSIMVTENGPVSLEYALEHASSLLEDAAERMFRMVRVGMEIAGKDADFVSNAQNKS